MMKNTMCCLATLSYCVLCVILLCATPLFAAQPFEVLFDSSLTFAVALPPSQVNPPPDLENLPLADAGKDCIIVGEPGIKVTLDGTASKNADTYFWWLLQGPDPSMWNIAISDPESQSPYFRPLQEGKYRFYLWTSKDNIHFDGDEVEIEFRHPPEIHASFTKQGKTYFQVEDQVIWTATTSEPIINFEGSVNSYLELQCFNQTTGKHYPGTFSIHDREKNFLIEEVGLISGDNRIVLLASDDLGNVCRDFYWITFNPSSSVVFGEVNMSPDVVYEDEIQSIEISVEIDPNLKMPAKLPLFEVNEQGNPIQIAAELLPVKSSYVGNDIFNVYTAVFSPRTSETTYYRVILTQGDEVFQTSLLSFQVLKRDTPEIQNIRSNAEAIFRLVVDKHFPYHEERLSRLDLERRIELIAEEMQQVQGVKSVRIRHSGLYLSVDFESGFSLHRNFGHIRSKPVSELRILENPYGSLQANTFLQKNTSASYNPFALTSNKFAGLHPFLGQPGNQGYDPYHHGGRLLRASSHFTSSVVTNEHITIWDYRRALQNPGIVMISSHGSDQTLLSGIRVAELTATDAKDISEGLIECTLDDVLINELEFNLEHDNVSFYTNYYKFYKGDRNTFVIHPSFFGKYIKGSNILFFAAWCNSLAGMQNTAFWKAMKQNGVASYVGFLDFVTFEYMGVCSKVFFETMLSGYTVEYASQQVKQKVRQTNGNNDLTFVGNPELCFWGREYYAVRGGKKGALNAVSGGVYRYQTPGGALIKDSVVVYEDGRTDQPLSFALSSENGQLRNYFSTFYGWHSVWDEQTRTETWCYFPSGYVKLKVTNNEIIYEVRNSGSCEHGFKTNYTEYDLHFTRVK